MSRRFVTTASALQWLHYGRSGTGFAIGYDPSVLASTFRLIRVRYAPSEQDDYLCSIIRAVSDAYEVQKGLLGDESVLEWWAADVVSQMISTAASHMKHEAFAPEQEWRLITGDLRLSDPSRGRAASDLKVRVVGDRLVPYFQVPFDPGAMREVVMGFGVTADTERVASLLLSDAFRGQDATPKLTRSSVPVRR
jgi:hypothetical protein